MFFLIIIKNQHSKHCTASWMHPNHPYCCHHCCCCCCCYWCWWCNYVFLAEVEGIPFQFGLHTMHLLRQLFALFFFFGCPDSGAFIDERPLLGGQIPASAASDHQRLNTPFVQDGDRAPYPVSNKRNTAPRNYCFLI